MNTKRRRMNLDEIIKCCEAGTPVDGLPPDPESVLDLLGVARTELPRIAKRLKWLEGWAMRVRGKALTAEIGDTYYLWRELVAEYAEGPDAEAGREG